MEVIAMQLDWLADALRLEGCKVEEHTGWKTRTLRPFGEYRPVGVIDHHTAGSSVLKNYPEPPYYRNASLETKCNLTIRPDGVVVTLNAGWAADSGYGDRKVLAAVRADSKNRPAPTDTYDDLDPVTPGGANPGVSGNAYFIDIEVQHLGNATPIVPVQRDALIRANAAICRQLAWDPATRVLGHREWTVRKVDPRWDGLTNPMPQIRLDTAARLQPEEETMFCKKGDKGPVVEYWQRIMMAIDPKYKPVAFGVYDDHMDLEVEKLTGVGDNIGPGEAASLHNRLAQKGPIGTITEADVIEIVNGAQIIARA